MWRGNPADKTQIKFFTMLNFLKPATTQSVQASAKKVNPNAEKEKAIARLASWANDPSRLMPKGITRKLPYFIELPKEGEKREIIAGVCKGLTELSALIPDDSQVGVLIACTSDDKGTENPKHGKASMKGYSNKHVFIISLDGGFSIVLMDHKTGAILPLTQEQQMRAMPV